jgi:hypothetical protein
MNLPYSCYKNEPDDSSDLYKMAQDINNSHKTQPSYNDYYNTQGNYSEKEPLNKTTSQFPSELYYANINNTKSNKSENITNIDNTSLVNYTQNRNSQSGYIKDVIPYKQIQYGANVNYHELSHYNYKKHLMNCIACQKYAHKISRRKHKKYETVYINIFNKDNLIMLLLIILIVLLLYRPKKTD